MYTVQIRKRVIKKLKAIPDPYQTQIIDAISSLAVNPRPMGSKKLINRPGYRIRVSNYRIIYEIFDEVLVVEVIEMGHRKDVYG
jgi:mRNA interferase RelE/StbE